MHTVLERSVILVVRSKSGVAKTTFLYILYYFKREENYSFLYQKREEKSQIKSNKTNHFKFGLSFDIKAKMQ